MGRPSNPRRSGTKQLMMARWWNTPAALRTAAGATLLTLLASLAGCGDDKSPSGPTEQPAGQPTASPADSGTGSSATVPAGRYVLALASNGQCVTGAASGTGAGTLALADCTTGTRQAFDLTVNTDGTSRLTQVSTGLALDLTAMSTADGASLQLWAANDSTAQRFTLSRIQGHLFSLVNAGSGKCISVQGASLQQTSCTAQAAQLFVLYPQSTSSATATRALLPYGRFSIQSSHSGLCLDLAGTGLSEGDRVVQAACTGADRQRFDLTLASDGGYRLRNVASGKLLDVVGAAMVEGTAVQQWTDTDGGNQHFLPVATGSTVQLKAQHSGQCLDLTAERTDVGAPIQQWSCGPDKANQQWRILTTDNQVWTPVLPPTTEGASGGDGGTGGGSGGGSGGGGGGSGGGTTPPGTGTSGPTPTTALTLPLELLGAGLPSAPVVATANLTLDANGIAAASELWMRCHRCGFFGPPEFEATTETPARIKGSLRVLGGVSEANAANLPWIDITDATMTLADAERVQGGLQRGGLYTVRMALKLDADTKARLVSGVNLVQFRFNGSDGESNGYRIIDLQLRNAQGVSLATNPVQRADIQAEKLAGRTWTADVAAGEALWKQQDKLLKSTLANRPIHAACASCHASDGRDLQYFNYSNNSIVQRSRFHGLSEGEGRQISAYLRYALQNLPHVAQAAPWNPPYQPGPGLDSRPIAEWSAGAGLDAVVDSPSQAVKALFGKPLDNTALALTQADIDKVMDATATLNAREVAMPIQFPDWNSYLPAMHPMDIWPTGANTAGSFTGGATFAGNGRLDPLGTSKRIAAWFESHRSSTFGDWSHLTPAQRNEIQSMIQPYGFEVYAFLGGGRGNHIASNGQYGAQVGAAQLQKLASSTRMASEPAAFTTNAFIERVVGSLLQWNLVQQWEWAQRYGLEGDQRWFIGDYDATTKTWTGRGEARGWPFNTVSAFYLAPHMVYQSDVDSSGKVTREWILAWETGNKAGSYYRTNAWYQAQVTINPGAQGDWVNYSVDWPYLTGFDQYLSELLGSATPAQATASMLSDIRLLQARIKSAQFVNNRIPLYVASDTRSIIDNRGRFSRAQVLKHLAPSNFMETATTQGNGGTPFVKLDQLQAGLYLKVLNGAFRQFNQVYATTDPAAWRRCDPNNMDLGEPEPTAGFAFCLDRSKRSLVALSGGLYAMNSENYRTTAEQKLQFSVWKGNRLGVEASRVNTLNDWVQRAWP
ncbi:RICIN domain-containing protein [Roseateles terrae]|uniref:Membrane protein YgcG/cytochrome c553 n=1 Tax=Roseateles terrae TaxID=431060 RepID=A0ABR6GPP2_9BURK|nr:RICIN domain-containing protein [Roseateles terrae]MBB3194093.1 putative membrane protein YgcG/cytochrome c553 [Roseateles terrae]